MTDEKNQRSSSAFEEQPAVSHSFANLVGEKGSIYSERSDSSVDRGQSPENVAVLQSRVTLLESSLESQTR